MIIVPNTKSGFSEEKKKSISLYEKSDTSEMFSHSGYRCTLKRGFLEEVHLALVDLEIMEETSFSFKIEKNKVILYFVLSGNFFANSNIFKQFAVSSGTHNIIYTHPIEGEFQFQPGVYELFYITLPFSLFKTYFPKCETVFENFHHTMSKKYFSFLRDIPGVISLELYKVIREISHFSQENDFKEIFLKGKLMELLSIQLQELCTICNPSSPIRKDHLEKMYAVRKFITEHLGEYYSLTTLAQQVGTNEYTLKYVFKELFGTTVFGYWHEKKMETAQKLLIHNEKSIREISEYIGYKNPQHFSTAFKKKFGMTPSAYQKQLNKN